MNVQNLLAFRYATKAYDPHKKISDADFAEIKAAMRLAPSSVNSQPWHFIVAKTDEGKARMAKATTGNLAFNAPKLLNASHVILVASKLDLDAGYLDDLLDQEEKDGRFNHDPSFKESYRGTRAHFAELHRSVGDMASWAEKQCFLNIGMILFSAAALGIDATPIEGFDRKIADGEFALPEKGYAASTLIALGYRADDDFNAKLPKSRFDEARIIEEI